MTNFNISVTIRVCADFAGLAVEPIRHLWGIAPKECLGILCTENVPYTLCAIIKEASNTLNRSELAEILTTLSGAGQMQGEDGTVLYFPDLPFIQE